MIYRNLALPITPSTRQEMVSLSDILWSLYGSEFTVLQAMICELNTFQTH